MVISHTLLHISAFVYVDMGHALPEVKLFFRFSGSFPYHSDTVSHFAQQLSYHARWQNLPTTRL